jgi:hypothetical protein
LSDNQAHQFHGWKGGDMKIIVVVILAVALSHLVFPDGARGEEWPSAIVFESGYVGVTGQWTPWTNFPGLGDPMFVVGHVSEFRDPLVGLMPTDQAYEVTYVCVGAKCSGWGIWENFIDAWGQYADFDGGFLRIYIDANTVADHSSPGTFLDGELVLELRVTSLRLQAGTWPQSAEIYEYLLSGRFIGGTWLHAVSGDKGGYLAENLGGFTGDIPEPMRQQGYVGLSETWMNILSPIAVKITTWGAVKALYQ